MDCHSAKLVGNQHLMTFSRKSDAACTPIHHPEYMKRDGGQNHVASNSPKSHLNPIKHCNRYLKEKGKCTRRDGDWLASVPRRSDKIFIIGVLR
jgi:hypothetical protein